MKCKIIYFSACGNTKLAAENIKEGILESGHECEIFEMRDIDENFDYREPELLGFMSPVFAWKDPTIFSKYLKHIPNLDGKYAFIAATANSDFGNVFYSINKALKKKGLTTIASCKICAPSTYTPWNTDKSDYEFKEEEIQRAFTFGTTIFNEYDDIILKKIKKIPKFKKSFARQLLSSFASHDFSLSFVVGSIKCDENLCTKCGICADNCAWGAITIEKDHFPKIDNGKCGGCCACINLCPTKALGNKKLKNKIKYHAPNYKGYKKKKIQST